MYIKHKFNLHTIYEQNANCSDQHNKDDDDDDDNDDELLLLLQLISAFVQQPIIPEITPG